MPDGRKKKVKVVVVGESSRHLHGSGATPDVRVPLIDQFCPISPLCMRQLLVKRRGGEEARRRFEDEGTEVNDESEIISVRGPLSLLVGASERASPLKTQLGELVSIQRQILL